MKDIETKFDYTVSFVTNNVKLINDFNIIKKNLYGALKFDDFISLENIINNDKYFNFASELVSRLIKIKNISDFNREYVIFRFLVMKADLFNDIQRKNTKLSNLATYNIIYWAKSNRDIDKLIKDSKDFHLRTKSNYECSKFNYDIIKGAGNIFKDTTLLLGFLGFVYLCFFFNHKYQTTFSPEKFELVKHKEKEYLNTFNQIKEKYNPKNKVDYYLNVDNVIKNFSRFDPIIKYKKENPSLYNNDFSYNLDKELMKKGFEVTIADTDNYILKANNYKNLIKIK
jgi:hypothetical protein